MDLSRDAGLWGLASTRHRVSESPLCDDRLTTGIYHHELFRFVGTFEQGLSMNENPLPAAQRQHHVPLRNSVKRRLRNSRPASRVFLKVPAFFQELRGFATLDRYSRADIIVWG